MKSFNIISISLFSLLVATPAFAGGTSATNTYINGRQTVKSTATIHNSRIENGTKDITSVTNKVETNFPRANGSTYFSGSGITTQMNFSTNVIDPFVVNSFTKLNESSTFSDVTTTNISEVSKTFNNIKTHIVETAGF